MGFADASVTEPRLSGRSSTIRQAKLSANGWRNGGRYGLAASEPAMNSSWISGIGSSAVALDKAGDAARQFGGKPSPRKQALPESRAAAGRHAYDARTGFGRGGHRSAAPQHGPGGFGRRLDSAALTGMSCRDNSSGSPMPESIKICGELIAPPQGSPPARPQRTRIRPSR